MGKPIIKPRFTLQTKYLIVVASVILVASGILSIYYYTAVKNKELAEIKSRGRAITLNFARDAEEGVLLSNTPYLGLLVKFVADDPDVVATEIASADGSILAKFDSDPALSDPSGSKFKKILSAVDNSSAISSVEYIVSGTGIRLFEYSVPITTFRVTRGREEIGLMFGTEAETEDQGRVQIGNAKIILSSARTLGELRNIQQNIIGITAVVALATILLTVPLVRITISPIRQLAEGTKAIAAGDLSQRIVATTNDEIGDLANSFNQMALDLEKYHKELREHSQTLEQRVRERTHELKQANEELKLANANLRKAQGQLIQAGKMAAMGEFGAGVAHELNQPLAGIKGYAQLLLSMIPEDSPLKPRLLQIDKQASRMKEITQTMWNLARQSNFEYSFIDIKKPISDSLILISEQFRQHQTEITTEIDNDLPLVYGDANQLHQVFLNFLTNARDAIDENKRGRVKIRAFPIADMRYVQIQIMDNGRGIPADIINSIFNPFFTTKAPGKGTGLGLSINFSIIEQHNGFINVYSEGSKGTVFSMVLPTKELARCSKNGEEESMQLLAPCWASHPADHSESHVRRPDCLTCDIYLRFQQFSPTMSLAEDFNKFITEAAESIS